MLYAHAVTKVLSNGDQTYDGLSVTEAVRNITFEGVGRSVVALSNNGDRADLLYEVMNYVAGTDGAMGSVPVGLYNSTKQQYTAMDRVVVWPGNTLEVPGDHLLGNPRLLSHTHSHIVTHIRAACMDEI